RQWRKLRRRRIISGLTRPRSSLWTCTPLRLAAARSRLEKVRPKSRKKLWPKQSDDSKKVRGNQECAAQQDEDVAILLIRKPRVRPDQRSDQSEMIDSA